jgi:phage terminase large subunit
MMVLKAIKPGSHISIRSGHGVGKTALLAWIILWFLQTRTRVRIPCTATTGAQLRDILWPEISKWIDRLPADMADGLEWMTERILVKADPTKWYAVARTARPEKPDALQGFHDDEQLFVADEASGIPDEVFEVAEGALTSPGVILILTGNPTRLTGEFYRSHHQDRHMWQTFHFDADESEIVSPEFAKRIAAKYGKDSDVYRVRVKGDFPLAESDQFIPLPLVEEARTKEATADGDVIWGIDPARFGDDESAIIKRRGNVVYHSGGVRGKDTMELAGIVARMAREEHPDHIMIDVIGIGAGVFDRLNEQGFNVIPVNVASRAQNPGDYYKCRDELWGNVKEALKNGLCLPDDDILAGQLSAPKYGFRSNGAIEIEGKDKMKARGVDSPDRADALCLSFYEPELVFDVGRL